MHASDWKKAVVFITQQNQVAATTNTEDLSSMSLSMLSLDNSGPPQVQYGSQIPLATSTPNNTTEHTHGPQKENSY